MKNLKIKKTSIKVNDGYVGERIEEKIARIVNNNDPITDGAPLIYTERSEGVKEEYDVRTDRFEVAVDGMDTVTRSKIARREQRMGEKTYDTMTPDQQSEFNKKFPSNKFAKDIAGGESTPPKEA